MFKLEDKKSILSKENDKLMKFKMTKAHMIFFLGLLFGIEFKLETDFYYKSNLLKLLLFF